MTRPFDPIRLLKDLSKELLRELFEREGCKLQLRWEELTRRDIDKMIVALMSMGDRNSGVHLALHEVHALSDERGLRVLAEELKTKSPDLVPEFAEWDNRIDKVLWAYLYARDAFDEAALFAQADALTSGRYWNRWNGLPTETVTITDRKTDALQTELRKYYWSRELRGQHCRVHYHPRCNGVEYFFAYLDDWPDQQLAFDDSGEMTPRSERYAFTNVFAFDSKSGCVDLVAKGGKNVQRKLRQAFCRSVLEIDVEDGEPVKPAFFLDHLLDPNLALRTDPEDCVSDVHITRIRWIPRHVVTSVRYEEVGFSSSCALSIASSELRDRLDQQGISPEMVTVKQVGFRLRFMGNGRGKPRTVTFNVGVPNSCDLKSKSEDVRAIGERCLQMWGISCD